jgi:cysteine desulfurase / selenocysteine lyase
MIIATNTMQKIEPTITKMKSEFPIFRGNKSLHYLDNASTTHKPELVINAVSDYYENSNSNIHRGVYDLSIKSSNLYEDSRHTVARFINAKVNEIVFLRGTTEAINLVAHQFVKPLLEESDEIILTHQEHHSNIIPWQIIAKEKKAVLRYLPINNSDQTLDISALVGMISSKTKAIACNHVSNVLGTLTPIEEITSIAKKHAIPVIVDGAQAVSRLAVDVEALGCDFYAFSGHKLYAPTGIGVLWGKEQHFKEMSPYHGGGGMIDIVGEQSSTYRPMPEKFEAGTPNISAAIGLASAINWLDKFDWSDIVKKEKELIEYSEASLAEIPDLRIFAKSVAKYGVISFDIPNIHPHDIATVLAERGVAVRAGHHCAQLLMKALGVGATTRLSIALYNDKSDIDALCFGLQEVKRLF